MRIGTGALIRAGLRLSLAWVRLNDLVIELGLGFDCILVLGLGLELHLRLGFRFQIGLGLSLELVLGLSFGLKSSLDWGKVCILIIVKHKLQIVLGCR